MKTKDAIERAGNAAALSRILNITQSAVSQWGDDVPELSLFRLEKARPKWFKRLPASAEASKPVVRAI